MEGTGDKRNHGVAGQVVEGKGAGLTGVLSGLDPSLETVTAGEVVQGWCEPEGALEFWGEARPEASGPAPLVGWPPLNWPGMAKVIPPSSGPGYTCWLPSVPLGAPCQSLAK